MPISLSGSSPILAEQPSSETPYADALAAYANRDTLRLNVPGHAADGHASPELARFFGEAVLRMDVPPLLAGLDKGAENPLARARDLAAQAWNARRTWFLTNGASQANRTICLALASLARTNRPVIVQRSAHSSVHDGIILAGLNPRFVSPSIDQDHGIAHGLAPAAVEAALAANPSAIAVYMTSPSYFGSVADVKTIAHMAHEAGAALIVDGAWASHFGFHRMLPANPLDLGADVLVSSTHKLGGSLTQSAMLHIADTRFGRLLEPLLVRAFALAQSTSENSLLLASLDIARAALVTGHDAITTAITAADAIRAEVRAAGRFGIVSDSFGTFDDVIAVDPLRVSIDVRAGGISGHEAREQLMTRGIYLEIATETSVVAVVAPGHEPDAARLLRALRDLPRTGLGISSTVSQLPAPGPLVMRPRDAFLRDSVCVDTRAAVGRVSAETLAAYPPGIPNLLPGEIVTEGVVAFLRDVIASPGGYIRGASDPSLQSLRVVKEPADPLGTELSSGKSAKIH